MMRVADLPGYSKQFHRAIEQVPKLPAIFTVGQRVRRECWTTAGFVVDEMPERNSRTALNSPEVHVSSCRCRGSRRRASC